MFNSMPPAVGGSMTSRGGGGGGRYEEHQQLDDMISELLGGGVLTSPDQHAVVERSDVTPTHGSITTQSGNSRTVVSWETTQAGQSRAATIKKHTVSTPSPNTKTETVKTVVKEEFSYTSPKQLHAALNSSQSPPVQSASGGGQGRVTPKLPPNAFSYGSVQNSKQFQETRTSQSQSSAFSEARFSEQSRDTVASPTPAPPPRDSSKQRMQSPTFRDRVQSPTIRDRVGSPTFGAPPMTSRGSRSPYLNSYEPSAAAADSRGYFSDSEHMNSMSWLEEQKRKLQAKREHRGTRAEHERRLVSELKSAAAQGHRKRTSSETRAADRGADMFDYVSRTTNRDVLMNGPARGRSPEHVISPTSVQRAYSEPAHDPADQYKTEKKYYVSGVERPPFTTHQTKYTFSVSSSKDGTRSKPPPSPAPLGRSAPASPIIPQRSQSSRDAMIRSQSMNREYGRGVIGQQRSYASTEYLDRFIDRFSDSGPLSPVSPRTHHSSYSNLYSPQPRRHSPHYTGYNTLTMQYHRKTPTNPLNYVTSLRRSATLPPSYIRHRASANSKFQPIKIETYSGDVRTHDGAYVRRVRHDEGKMSGHATRISYTNLILSFIWL